MKTTLHSYKEFATKKVALQRSQKFIIISIKQYDDEIKMSTVYYLIDASPYKYWLQLAITVYTIP